MYFLEMDGRKDFLVALRHNLECWWFLALSSQMFPSFQTRQIQLYSFVNCSAGSAFNPITGQGLLLFNSVAGFVFCLKLRLENSLKPLTNAFETPWTDKSAPIWSRH
jgi:hypothetical protein